MSIALPEEFLYSIDSTISRFELLADGEPVQVALSGGKDSLLLCLAFRELGRPYVPVTIDMGYEAGWAARIVQTAAALGIHPEIVSARDQDPARLPQPVMLSISRRISLLDQQASAARSPDITPCTYCYSSKVLMLEATARRRGLTKVAFAHHMTDAAASLVKESLLHIDRTDRGHERYARANLEPLVEELRVEALSYDPAGASPVPLSLIERIDELVEISRVDTDEPPRQPLRRTQSDGIEIVRPMFDVAEGLIRRIVIDLGIRSEGSNCGHGATALTETPREMVHHRILAECEGLAFFEHVRELVHRGISSSGSGKVGARYRRSEFLGHDYKVAASGYDKL